MHLQARFRAARYSTRHKREQGPLCGRRAPSAMTDNIERSWHRTIKAHCYTQTRAAVEQIPNKPPRKQRTIRDHAHTPPRIATCPFQDVNGIRPKERLPARHGETKNSQIVKLANNAEYPGAVKFLRQRNARRDIAV